MDHKPLVRKIMDAMSQGQVAPLFDAMAEDVTWRWMGVGQWSKAFDGKQIVVDKLFGGKAETLSPSSRVEVRCIHADGDCVVVEHLGRNELPDGRRYDNNYCWVLRFGEGSIQEVREYMDTELVRRDLRRRGFVPPFRRSARSGRQLDGVSLYRPRRRGEVVVNGRLED